jgi:hypothetical protein
MAAQTIPLPPPSLARRLSTFFYRRPRLSLFATLALPLFWATLEVEIEPADAFRAWLAERLAAARQARTGSNAV